MYDVRYKMSLSEKNFSFKPSGLSWKLGSQTNPSSEHLSKNLKSIWSSFRLNFAFHMLCNLRCSFTLPLRSVQKSSTLREEPILSILGLLRFSDGINLFMRCPYVEIWLSVMPFRNIKAEEQKLIKIL